jgi:pimeloyl-ACP methyl ester carboxylesterase
VFVRRFGAGETIVCVHGIGVSSRYFVPLARELAHDHRVLVPDLPGYGRTPKPPRALGISELADALREFLDGEGLDRVPLVANSMGCQIVVDLTVRTPDRVASLVLVGPTVDPYWRSVRQQVPRFALDCIREPPSLLAIIALDYAIFGPRRFVATARSALRDRPEDKLPHVRAPTLVVRGERDGFVSQRWCDDAARLLPHGRLAVVPGVAHAAHYAAPGRVAALVREELEQRI